MAGTRLIRTIAEMRGYRRRLGTGRSPVGFVPTMGALHFGHASLIEASVRAGDRAVVSIFVNPSQFGPKEDFARYPRPLERDLALCESAGAAAVFAPETREMYPEGFDTWVQVGGITEGLCGASRPGHFRGVATIVAKLFGIVRPDRAYFGQKDAQQVAVIRKMAGELDMGIEIVVCPTVREESGLAMSSRNAYLGAREREAALGLSSALAKAAESASKGMRDAEALKAAMRRIVEDKGGGLARIDYVEIVDPSTFKPVSSAVPGSLALLAVYVGGTRLIDNAFLG